MFAKHLIYNKKKYINLQLSCYLPVNYISINKHLEIQGLMEFSNCLVVNEYGRIVSFLILLSTLYV